MLSKKWIDRFMDEAKHRAAWSKDPSRKIGAVAVNESTKTIISSGYNGLPRGLADTKERLNNRELKYCYIVHAEMNCIYNASFIGCSLQDSLLFVYGLPVCSKCALGIVQVGIREVFMSGLSGSSELWLKEFEITKEILNEVGIPFHFI